MIIIGLDLRLLESRARQLELGAEVIDLAKQLGHELLKRMGLLRLVSRDRRRLSIKRVLSSGAPSAASSQ